MKRRVIKRTRSKRVSKASPRKKVSKKKPSLGKVVSSPVRAFDFPAVYGEDRLALVARDPWWLYAYWEITPKTERQAILFLASQKASGLKKVLRIYRKDGPAFDVEVGNFTDNWYVEVGLPDRVWYSELGLRDARGRFHRLIRSNRVRTPRYGISDEIDPDWRMPDVRWDKLLEISGAFAASKSSFDLAKEVST